MRGRTGHRRFLRVQAEQIVQQLDEGTVLEGPGGLSEFLARSAHGRNEKLWTVAQAVSEVLPDGDKEKQLVREMQVLESTRLRSS